MKKMGNYQKAMTPEQQRVVSDFNNKSEQEKAQIIADVCNKNNISIEQLKTLISTR